MRHLLSTSAIILALTVPALAQQATGETQLKPSGSSAVEASSELSGAATEPNKSTAQEIDSQAAAPEVQVKQDASEAELSKEAAEEHKQNVMTNGGSESSGQAREATDTTTTPVPGMNTAATAQDRPAATGEKFVTSGSDGQFRASSLIGMRVYASEQEVDPAAPASEDTRRDWDDIGEINDIVVSTSGDVTAVILGVGGFLGIGERDVAVNMSELRVVRESADASDFFLVVRATRNELENAPEFKRVSLLGD